MSEVSLETESGKTSAEDPQMDCKETDEAEEGLSEGVKPHDVDCSTERVGSDDVLYDIDIDSAEENSETNDKDVQEEDEGIESEGVVTCSDGDAAHTSDSVDNGGHVTNHRVETPEECGDSYTATQVMFIYLNFG